MTQSHIKICIHAVLGTKQHDAYIKENAEATIHNIIVEQLNKTGCKLIAINGITNHVHLLFLLATDKSIQDVMHQVKGGSSYAINQTSLLPWKFNWQNGYGAFSVSESNIKKVKAYISRQKEHHRKVTFTEEYNKFLEGYKLENR